MRYIFQGALEKKEGVPLPQRLKGTGPCLAHSVIHRTLLMGGTEMSTVPLWKNTCKTGQNCLKYPFQGTGNQRQTTNLEAFLEKVLDFRGGVCGLAARGCSQTLRTAAVLSECTLLGVGGAGGKPVIAGGKCWAQWGMKEGGGDRPYPNCRQLPQAPLVTRPPPWVSSSACTALL